MENAQPPQVILGGGRKKFTPKGVDDPEGGDGGKRDDGKNLIQTWIDQKQVLGNASYVWHREDLLSLDTANTDYLMGKSSQIIRSMQITVRRHIP